MFDSLEHAKAVAYAISKIQTQRNVKIKRDLTWTHPEFPKQNAFIEDTATLIAAQCPRRSGKSEGLGRKQLKECFDYPGSNQLYIGLTLGSARAIMWEPVIKHLNAEKNLGGIANESRLEMQFRHAPGVVSQYSLFGVDSSAREIDKKLGGKYRSIVIDEAAFFKQDLQAMVYEKLLPCVADYDGWIALASTTSEYTKGLFYDVTNLIEKGWSVHKWTGDDNPFMRDKLQRQITLLKKNKPRIEQTPAFQRMYMNKWVIDHDSFCYKYNRDINEVANVNIEPQELINVLGIDLGFNDPTAFALLSYNEYDPVCYIRHAYKRGNMIISEVAERIQWYIEKYNPVACVVDNASKQAVEELKQKFAIPLIAAEKTGKAEFIEIMNSDFILGNIKLLPEASDLSTEYGQLIWDKDKFPKKIEHPGCDNHLCFVAGTKIRTPNSQKLIESLSVGDLVETRKGPKPIEYTIARKSDVLKVVLNNGRSIVCTPDHPFYCEGKWVQAKDLKKGSELLSWAQHRRKLKESGLTGMYSEDTQEISILNGNPNKERLNASTYTERYGNQKKDQYPKDSTYITKTAMSTITDCVIWNALKQSTIEIYTKKAYKLGTTVKLARNFSKKSGLLRQLGTSRMREGLGIEITESRHSALLKPIAHGVMLNMKNPIWQKTKMGAARENALQQREGILESTISNGCVNGAKENSSPTNIPKENIAPVRVLEIITNTEKETVYNITVAEAHEYFAEDVLVSNCDAALYAFRFCYQYRYEKKPKKLTAEEHLEALLDQQFEEEQSLDYWER